MPKKKSDGPLVPDMPLDAIVEVPGEGLFLNSGEPYTGAPVGTNVVSEPLEESE